MLLEIIKLFGCALLACVVYVALSVTVSSGGAKAVAFSLIRAQGSSLMVIGFFTIVLGFVLSRLDLISDVGGRPHFTLR